MTHPTRIECGVRLVRSDPTELWEVTLPWTKPPLSMNDRRHWRAQAREVASVRETVEWIVRPARLGPFHRVRVALHYRPRDRRVRDRDNPIATLKPCADALVSAGVVRDDSPDLMVKDMPVIHPVDRSLRPAVWLTIEALPAVEAAL